MLTPYWGEFLTHPVPLELSIENCSYACAYCFASGFKSKVTGITNLIAKAGSRQTLAAHLLNSGAPVLISNRCDPFSDSNVDLSLPIMRLLTERGNGIAIQTKGGKRIDEALEFLKPSCWYISISFYDEALRARIEPGAPTLTDRFALIEKLLGRGHTVYVGVNPLVPEWLPKPEALIGQLARLGVHGVWAELLHLRQGFAEELPNRTAILGADIVYRASHIASLEELDLLYRTRQLALEYGLEVFTWAQSNASKFWEPYYKLYSGCFPTNQDYINHCHARSADLTELPFSDYWRMIGHKLPAGKWLAENYIRVPSRFLFLSCKIPSRLTYEEIAKIAWVKNHLPFSIARHKAMAVSVDDAGNPYLDEAGLPFLVFNRDESTDFKEGGE